MIRLMGLAAVVPISLLLTINYFVLYANRNVDSARLGRLGRAVSVLLWVSAGLMALGGLYIIITGHHPMEPFIRHMLRSAIWR